MNIVAAFILGLLIGWLVEWVIDWFYWRGRVQSLAEENARLQRERSDTDGEEKATLLRAHKKLGEENSGLQLRIAELEDEINRIVRLHGWAASELLRIEAMKFRNGKPVSVEHVMGFEHVE